MISTVIPVRLALVALAMLTSAGAASAAVGVSSAPPCQAVTITAFAEADAWVAENSTSNTGSDAILTVEANPSSGNSRALVRFVMPSVPQHCIVESARLRLYTSSGTDGARVEAVRLASAWSEGSVVWTNQPAPTGAVAVAWSTDGYMRWNVTSQVRSIYDTGANHGFLIRDAAEGTDAGVRHGFNSKEKGENPPELVIVFAESSSGGPRDDPPPPVPAAVSCGEVLTQSTLVTNDLQCLGDGLVIGAPRIIVDLNSHTIGGSGSGSGIHNDGYPGVIIRNGTVANFDYGVRLLPESSLNVVEQLTLRLNQVAAIELSDVAGNQVRDNTLDQNGGGIDLVNGTTQTTATRNAVTTNGQTGLVLRDAEGNWIEFNSVVGSGGRGIWLQRSGANSVFGNAMISGNSDSGIELSDGSHGNLIDSNVLSQNGDYGIHVIASDWNQLLNNTVHLMSDSGINLENANDSVVRGNDVRFNAIGIMVDGSRNLIEANNASESSGNGIEIGPGAGNHVLLNAANVNNGTGIYVEASGFPGIGSLIEGNTASANGTDGIFVQELGGHTITDNVARNNPGWGINAVGNTDGGGNVATGNGQIAQCLGVACGSAPPGIETTINSGPPATTTGTSATFIFSANEAGSTFQCALDSDVLASCASPLQYTGLATGAHQFRVVATDPAGNVDATPAIYSWTIVAVGDTTPPQTTITSVKTWDHRATFTFSANEPGATFQCSLDAAAYATCTSPHEVLNLTTGAHEFRVRATDPSGNVDATPASHSWTIKGGRQ